MSVKMMGLVWDLDLPRDMKYVLLAYADHAQHDGTDIRPAISTISQKTGYERRSVQRVTRRLEDSGYLILDGVGPRGTNRYKIPMQGGKITPQVKCDGGDILTPPTEDEGGGILPGGGDILPRGGATRESPEPSFKQYSKYLTNLSLKLKDTNLTNLSLKTRDSSLTNLSSAELDDDRIKLIQVLRSMGVYLKMAQGLVDQYPQDYIAQKIAYFQYALFMDYADNAGWLVAAIKQDYPPPFGLDAHKLESLMRGDMVLERQVVEDIENQESGEDAIEQGEVWEPDPETLERLQERRDGRMSPLEAWGSAMDQVRLEMPRAAFDTWVRDSELLDYVEAENIFVAGVRNAYARDWLESRLTGTVELLLKGIMDQEAGVRFVVYEGLPTEVNDGG